MRVVTITGPDKIRVTEVDEPQGSEGALVRLERAGICGTELKIVSGFPTISYPRVLGHEMVGTLVREAQDGRLGLGERVMINPGIYCESCHLCKHDRPHLCGRGGLRGRDLDGVFTEVLQVEERFLHTVPDRITADEAGLLQVLGTVVHAQNSVSVSSDTVAVVIGLGVSGLLHAQLLSQRGVGCVIGTTRSQWKLDLAKALGIDHAATPDRAAEVVKRVSGGRGADLVVEAVGTDSTVLEAIELCARGGDVIVYGTVTSQKGKLPYYQLYFKEITLHNPRAARPRDYDAAIELVAAGRIELAPLVTARYPLAQAHTAFAAAAQSDHLKVLFTP